MAVKLQFDDSVDVVDGTCQNVSIGGMHVVADSPRPQGSLVRFELAIDDDVGIRGLGEVVWMRSESSGPGREAGMGVKFRFLEQRDRQTIFRLVSEHIKKRLEQKHPGAETPPEDEAASVFMPPAPAAVTPPAPEPEAPPAPAPASFFAEPTPPAAPARAPATASEDEELLPSFDETPREQDWEVPDFDLPTYRDAPEPAAAEPKQYDPGALYRARPAPRRDFPVLPLVALLLVAGAAGVYLGWERIFGPSTPPPPVEAPAPAADGPEASDPGAAVDERPVDEVPPLSIETGTEAAPAPPAPPPPAPPPPPPPPSAAAFTRVVDVSWTRLPGGIKVSVETDGAIPPERYDTFRLDGENPREVVRLRGVVGRYATGEIQVTGAPVRRIRIGYHANRELHIVLDMLDRSTRIQRLRVEGTTLEVVVE